MKLDVRNIEFFNQNKLWRFGDPALGKTNKNARNILVALNDCIQSKEPTWPYTPSHLNAAIYEESSSMLARKSVRREERTPLAAKAAEAFPRLPRGTSQAVEMRNPRANNPGMFTPENAKRFWQQVERRGDDECWRWKGPIPERGYRDRRYGLFRVPGCGYAMNQRFAYIDHYRVPVDQQGMKVEPAPWCKLGELCCNPLHIQPKDRGRRRQEA